MQRIMTITLGILLSALLARDAASQWNVERFDDNRNRIYTTFGLDPALVTSVGYGRVVRLGGHNFQLAGDAAVAATGFDANDFRGRLGVHTSLLRARSLHLTGSATFVARGTENAIFRGFNFGTDVAGTLGVYRRGWFAAGEVGFDKAIITHLTHSAWYRQNYYPDARDGWYLDAGGTYRFGATGGIGWGRMEVVGRAGILRTERLNEATPPLYGSIGVGFRY
jgi:hypothetical protein